MKESAELVPRERAIALRPSALALTPGAVATATGLAAAVALRMAILFRYRIDSDETQHLHVVWGWTHGLLQYRDLFDNHMPLFHILSIPLLRLAGERPEALILGRLAMIPIVALITILTYRIAASCYSPQVAVTATVLGIFAPDFFLCSVEYRPDVLWAACWLASLAILVSAPVTVRRAAAAGLMLGLAAAISAKTSLLAVGLAIAAVVAVALPRVAAAASAAEPSSTAAEGGRRYTGIAAAFAGAALAPPLAIAAYFAMRGAWESFLYCVVTHNLVTAEHPRRGLYLIPCIALIAACVRHILRSDAEPEIKRRRIFLVVAALAYGTALISLWPIVETEHWLPFYPAVAAALAPLLLTNAHRPWPRTVIAILAFELFWILRVSTPWRDEVVPSTTMIHQTQMLTAPGDKVLDLKGELLFRQRAFFPVLEKITKRAISGGRIADTLAADVLRAHTMVVIPDNASFPREGRAFLLHNFVSAGCVRVPGMLVPAGQTFRIELPAEYSVVSERGTFHGSLDGVAYAGPRTLGAGLHTLAPALPSDPSAVIWTRAAALGLSPFVSDRRCPARTFSE